MKIKLDIISALKATLLVKIPTRNSASTDSTILTRITTDKANSSGGKNRDSADIFFRPWAGTGTATWMMFMPGVPARLGEPGMAATVIQ